MNELDGGYFGSCKAIVLDGRGELLSSIPADDVDSECTPESIARFPELFSARIRKALQEPATLQELERRWKKEPDQQVALDRYLQRLVDLSRERLAQSIAQGVAEDASRTRKLRSLALAWTFEQRGIPLELFETPPERREAYIAEGESLLAEFADCRVAGVLLDGLLHNGYGEQFDVPGKMPDVFARLEKAASLRPDPAPLRARISDLRALLEEWKKTLEELPKLAHFEEDSEGFALVRGKLGDARTVLRVFTALPATDQAKYGPWIREARAKLAREEENL